MENAKSDKEVKEFIHLHNFKQLFCNLAENFYWKGVMFVLELIACIKCWWNFSTKAYRRTSLHVSSVLSRPTFFLLFLFSRLQAKTDFSFPRS